MKRLFTALFIFSLIGCLSLQAQNDVKMEPVNPEAKQKEIKTDKSDNDTVVVNVITEQFGYWNDIKPTIILQYGWGTPSLYDEVHKDYQNPFIGEFVPKQWGQVSLGTTSQKSEYPRYNVGGYDFNGVFLKYMGPNQYIEQNYDADKYNLKILQFGFQNLNGYGYQAPNSWFGIYLYTGSGLNWSDVSYTIDEGGDSSSNEALNTFDGSMRFGQTWESGLRFSLIGPLNAFAGYEENIIFPRHLFWKWAVSAVIEGAGINLLGAFSRWIMSKSPVAGPIVDWALKTGAYYVLYQLRMKNMNWPYETAPPLVITSWKAGLSFEF
jgi:hypothetical protein